METLSKTVKDSIRMEVSLTEAKDLSYIEKSAGEYSPDVNICLKFLICKSLLSSTKHIYAFLFPVDF